MVIFPIKLAGHEIATLAWSVKIRHCFSVFQREQKNCSYEQKKCSFEHILPEIWPYYGPYPENARKYPEQRAKKPEKKPKTFFNIWPKYNPNSACGFVALLNSRVFETAACFEHFDLRDGSIVQKWPCCLLTLSASIWFRDPHSYHHVLAVPHLEHGLAGCRCQAPAQC